MDVDVLIVGLGPAGASVLYNLSKGFYNGFSILAIDQRKTPGFPVQCAEFMPSPDEMSILMPDVIESRTLFHFEDQYISQNTNQITFITPNGKLISTPFKGYSLKRGLWNNDLIKSSIKGNVEVWNSTSAIKMEGNNVTLLLKGNQKVDVKAKIIVGGDGVNSRIAQWSGLNETRTSYNFAIVKQHLMTNILDESYNPENILMIFGEKYAPGAYGWVIPKSKNTANVGTGVRVPMLRKDMNISKALDHLINFHPIVKKMLTGAEISETIGGAVPVGLPFKKTVNPVVNSLLIGDACCQVVSSVGGGIPPSIVAGKIAARSISNYINNDEPLISYHQNWTNQMLSMFKKSFFIRNFFDQISEGRDSRVQWYMNRLTSKDIDNVVHCRIPWKLSLASTFVRPLNQIIK